MQSWTAIIGEGAAFGVGAVIEDGVTAGDGCRLGHYAVTREGDIIGHHVRIDDHAVIGKHPKNALIRAGSSAEKQPPSRIDSGGVIGRGVAMGNSCQIGSRCKLETNVYITYSTVGDDCFIAPGVVTSNDSYVSRDPVRFDRFKRVTIEDGGRLIVAGNLAKTLREVPPSQFLINQPKKG